MQLQNRVCSGTSCTLPKLSIRCRSFNKKSNWTNCEDRFEQIRIKRYLLKPLDTCCKSALSPKSYPGHHCELGSVIVPFHNAHAGESGEGAKLWWHRARQLVGAKVPDCSRRATRTNSKHKRGKEANMMGVSTTMCLFWRSIQVHNHVSNVYACILCIICNILAWTCCRGRPIHASTLTWGNR